MTLTEQEKTDFNRALIDNNKIISEQPEHELSSKVYWQKPFYCREKGCQEKTCLTRRLNTNVFAQWIKKEVPDYYEPLCEKHFEISHAIGVVELSKVK